MKKVHIVPHTHWDREWYFTLEDSNLLLVEHMDYLIDFLEKNPQYPSFTFDGQSSIIIEYLKRRPEKKTKLKKLIKAKRIFVGPWYTQTDTLHVKSESILRNLLHGIKISNDFGHTMNIGYLPDVFGQNSYLPAFFQHFNLNNCILQRGIWNDEVNKKSVNFNWVSPNNVKIKTNYLYFGYGPGKFLSDNDDYLKNNLLPILNKLNEISPNNDILLPSGGDQALIRTHFPKTIKKINQKNKQYQLIMSDYEKFMNLVKPNQTFIYGELYATQKSRMHRTIHSQRQDIKALNYKVEAKLIEKLEPLAAIMLDLKLMANFNFLNTIWQKLFDVHAHDSIGGCNSDTTNEHILSRLNKLNEEIDGHLNIMMKKIALNLQKQFKIDDNQLLLIFNFNLINDKEIKATIFTKKANFKIYDEANKEIKYYKIAQKKLSGGQKIIVSAEGEKVESIDPYYETEIKINYVKLPLGYIALKILETDEVNKIEKQKITKSKISFNNYEINLQNNEFKIKNWQNKITANLTFAFQSDKGDSYDFSPLKNEKETIIKNYQKVDVIKNSAGLVIDLTYQVSKNKINTKILINNQGDIEVWHNTKNKVKDSRFRVIWETNLSSTNEHYAHQGYSEIKRMNIDPYLTKFNRQEYAEMPLSIYPFEKYFYLKNKNQFIGIYNSNTQEYEIIKNKNIALTLFRAVSFLGRDNLLTRPGRASGINNVIVKTPNANLINQNIQNHYFLNISQKNNFLKKALTNNGSFAFYQLQTLNSLLKRVDRFEMPVKAKSLHKKYQLFQGMGYISAIKPSWDHQNIVVRISNLPSVKTSLKTDKVINIADGLENIKQKNQKQIKIDNKNFKTIILTEK